MAEAFARMSGHDVQPYSAGSRPSGQINPRAIESMKKLGYDLTTHTSKSVNNFAKEKFDAVVTMGCGDECPWIEAKKHVDWEIPDPRNMETEDFNAVRDLIRDKVQQLLQNL